MPQNRLWIREEMRLLGAIQIMTGLILLSLGLIWAYLFRTQSFAFGSIYLPLTSVTGYPFWSSHLFIISGAFAVLVEKRRSKMLVSYTLVMNIMSACIAVIGLLLISLELLIFSLSSRSIIWPQKSGKILSEYLFVFTFLELFVTATVTHWVYQAKRRI